MRLLGVFAALLALSIMQIQLQQTAVHAAPCASSSTCPLNAQCGSDNPLYGDDKCRCGACAGATTVRNVREECTDCTEAECCIASDVAMKTTGPPIVVAAAGPFAKIPAGVAFTVPREFNAPNGGSVEVTLNAVHQTPDDHFPNVFGAGAPLKFKTRIYTHDGDDADQSFTGPTLRVAAGSRILLTLRNQLTQTVQRPSPTADTPGLAHAEVTNM
jgi:hypothetical protein